MGQKGELINQAHADRIKLTIMAFNCQLKKHAKAICTCQYMTFPFITRERDPVDPELIITGSSTPINKVIIKAVP